MMAQFRLPIPAVQEKVKEYELGTTVIVVIEMNKIDVFPVFNNFLLEPNIRTCMIGVQNAVDYLKNLLLGEGHPREIQNRAKNVYMSGAFVYPPGKRTYEAIKINLDVGLMVETESLGECNEIFFDPYIAGLDRESLPEIIDEAVTSCDTNIRKPMRQNLVVWHRNIDIKDLEVRLEKVLQEFSPDYKITGRILTDGVLKRFD